MTMPLAEQLARNLVSSCVMLEPEKIPSLHSRDWPKNKPVVPGLIFMKFGVASVGSL